MHMILAYHMYQEVPVKKGPGRPPIPGRIRKTMELDPHKLAQARAVLGTETDTETVDQALALVGFQDRLIDSFEALAAAGGLADFWEGESRPARGKRGRRVAEQPDG